MPEVLRGKEPRIFKVIFNPIESGPFSDGFQMSEGDRSQSESHPPKIHGTWREREEAEHHDAEKDIQLRQFMENVKRYIRNIDISSL